MVLFKAEIERYCKNGNDLNCQGQPSNQQQFSSAGLRLALLSVLDHPPNHPHHPEIVVLLSLGTEFATNYLIEVAVLFYDIL